MAKTKISEYSSTANSNTDIASINIDEGCAPSGINNAIRALMAQLKDFQTGAAGDPVTVGDVLTVKGASINDTNGNELFKLTATASAVNELTIANAATGGSPTISATGGDTNIGINLTPKGTGGVVFPAGDVGTPSITTSGDLNTGIYFPAADKIALATGGTQAVIVDSSQNVGIGTSSPSEVLQLGNGSKSTRLKINSSHTGYEGPGIDGFDNGTREWIIGSRANIEGSTSTGLALWVDGANPLAFYTNGGERARIDSSGNFLIAKSAVDWTSTGFQYEPGTRTLVLTSSNDIIALRRNTNNGNAIVFYKDNSVVGSISVTGSATTYSTSSDYRLKENVQPMQNALVTVQQLRPVTYTWKTDGADGQGFIAHELQAVVPDCVTGEKDAVDAEGNPVYQGIDTSFLVATLTAAIQEQQAIITTLTERITALEAK